jgi:DNA-binding response OmpR family regulator
MTRVLLAEDDTAISEPLARALRREGYDVDVREDGLAALDGAKENPDLVLLDLGLPKIDGLEVCRRIRASGELVRIDSDGRRAWFKGQELQLTAKEFDLLRVLVREQGKVVSREQLMREIWDTAWFGSTKTLDMHISVLRRKLGDDATSPQYIATVRGVGFRFERPQAD